MRSHLYGDDLFMIGYENSSGAGGYDLWLVRADLNGNEIWSETYGGAGTDIGWDVRGNLASGLYIVGSTTSFGAAGQDAWLLKVKEIDPCATAICGRNQDKTLICHTPVPDDDDGEDDDDGDDGDDDDGDDGDDDDGDDDNEHLPRTICVSEKALEKHLAHGDVCGVCPTPKTGHQSTAEEKLSSQGEGISIFPNPFSNTTSISFKRPQGGSVKLEVFDMTGRLVTTLYDGVVNAGQSNTMEFDASQSPTGIYITKLSDSKGESLYKRMIVH